MLDFMGLGFISEEVCDEQPPWQRDPEAWARSFNTTAAIAAEACACSLSKDRSRLQRTREFCVLGKRVIPKRDHAGRSPEYDKDGHPIKPGHPVLRAHQHINLELVSA